MTLPTDRELSVLLELDTPLSTIELKNIWSSKSETVYHALLNLKRKGYVCDDKPQQKGEKQRLASFWVRTECGEAMIKFVRNYVDIVPGSRQIENMRLAR